MYAGASRTNALPENDPLRVGPESYFPTQAKPLKRSLHANSLVMR